MVAEFDRYAPRLIIKPADLKQYKDRIVLLYRSGPRLTDGTLRKNIRQWCRLKLAGQGLRDGRFRARDCPMIRLAKMSVLMTAGSLALFGQILSIGVVGGVRASDDFEYAAISESRRYVVGPAVGLALPLGFSVEFEALYRRQGYSTGNGTPLYSASIREADNVWEFPLLARYRIPVPAIRPFAEAGWVPRIMHGYRDASGSYLTQLNPATFTSYNSRTHVDWPTTNGVVVGGGIQFGAGPFLVAPEIRYTHWNRQAINGYFSDGPGYGSTQNQLDILLGVRYRIGMRTH